MTAIWWIRRDMRLHDAPALHAALAHGPVVPVFILDDTLLKNAPLTKKKFLVEALHSLDGELYKRGARLILREGRPADVLRQLCAAVGAEQVVAEEDYTPYARGRDQQVAREVRLQLVVGQTMYHPAEVVKTDGKPYVVYTPYCRQWKARLPERMSPLAAPERIEMPVGIPSEAIPESESSRLFPASEADAQRRLAAFISERLSSYATDRDRMDLEGTSALSPYLHLGLLSMGTAVQAARDAAEQAISGAAHRGFEAWLNELAWREFYIQILYHFPRARNSSFRAWHNQITWRNDPSEFEAWKAGQTGVPVVDAAMRQLQETGWIHNRARMIAASFLVKDLLIDWRWGERWFMDNLIDGDVSANNGAWQWVAGTGTDAAPYFRVFNPVLQSRRFDPDGRYIRWWVPELRDVPRAVIHAPWEKGIAVPGYPSRPITDHAAAIRRVRLAYETAKDHRLEAADTAGSA